MHKGITATLIIIVIITAFFISNEYLKSSDGGNIKTVSGKVFIQENYCDGANPGEEILGELSTVVYPNAKLFVTNAVKATPKEFGYDMRYRSVGPIIKEFSSDENGNFVIDLSSGIYCFVSKDGVGKDAWRNEYCTEVCLDNMSVDSQCSNYYLDVKEDIENIKIRLYKYCGDKLAV